MSNTPLKTILLSLFLFAVANAFAGYDAHISRAKDWTESKKTPITLIEWTDFTKTDPEFRLVDAGVAKNPATGETIEVKGSGMAVWTDPKNKKEWYFSYHEGEISVRDPEGDVLTKMKSIARKLKAKVIGDEGEEL